MFKGQTRGLSTSKMQRHQQGKLWSPKETETFSLVLEQDEADDAYTRSGPSVIQPKTGIPQKENMMKWKHVLTVYEKKETWGRVTVMMSNTPSFRKRLL